MFYRLQDVLTMDGRTQYLDLSEHLHRFLQCGELSVDMVFRTLDPNYPTLLGVYFKESLLPDFSLCLYKGRGAATVKRGGSVKLLYGGEAVCDGKPHLISFRGQKDAVRLFVDGELIAEDTAPGVWCEFGYVGFATVGRGTRADAYTYFKGDILSLLLSQKLEPLPAWERKEPLCRYPLFVKGLAGSENYRIPSILTVGDVTIATADARLEAPGDNPNHILRAVRISKDSGETWSETQLFCDYGGSGRDDGAAAIDGSLLYDSETDTVFMLFSHTSRGIGAFQASLDNGFDKEGRRCLWDREGKEYIQESDGRVCTLSGGETGYRVGPYGKLWYAGEEAGSICHGEDRVFRQADTSFLQLICSTDHGKTWSDPMELNPQVKASWMRFMGAGPGTGIQIQEGPHKGRLVYPVYFMNESRVASSGAIYSDDHGKSWQRGTSVNDGRVLEGVSIQAKTVTQKKADLGECQITELPGGKLRIFLRNLYGPHTLSAYSEDGGESWTGFHETALADPKCQSHVLRLKHQDRDVWLFSNPANSAGRVQGVVRASFDGGETWPVSRLVEPGEFGYSCLTQLPDGQIGLLYEGRDIDLRFMKFPLEWILEGRE